MLRRDARVFESKSDAGIWLAETFGVWEKELLSSEREAVRRYKGVYYIDINGALRGDVPPNSAVLDVIEDLDLALSRMRLPEAIRTFRGVRDAAAIGKLREGQIFTDPAYGSTSLLRKIAEGFSVNENDEDPDEGAENLLIETVIPGGTQVGAYVGAPDLVDELNEYEILLPRDTRHRILEIDDDSLRPVIVTEVLT